ncbi:MAG: hypothetical protein E7812_17835 [Phenylobacterium sp.]|nr:MAG: hypothetical protein E7812_17835 [Phenylobacterium sp.]
MTKKIKSFLPKKIAGVKVPKSVRRGRFGELLASPTGQALIAEAVQRHHAELETDTPVAGAEGWTERDAAANPGDPPPKKSLPPLGVGPL